MDARETLNVLLQQGRFRETYDLIQALPPDVRRRPDIGVTEAEVMVETGALSSGLEMATKIFETTSSPELRAIALRIMGQVAFYQGDADESRTRLRQSRDLALTFRQSDPALFASTLLVRW